MTASTGLYALKPWYADRLASTRNALVRARIHPDAVSVAGIGFGAVAGVALATLPAGPLAGVVVAGALAARLACANLDGGLARQRGLTTVRGAILNEVGDRAAELAALAGLLALAPTGWVAGAALAASAPSWVALAGAAAGQPRIQGGPVGKTERALLLVVVAATGWVGPVLAVLAGGSLLTAVLRGTRLARTAGGPR